MRSTVLTAVERLEHSEMPDPRVEHHELVVAVEAVAICGSDLSAFKGTHPRMRPPLVLGHEFAGRVVEIGEGIENGLLGARVAVDPVLSCGRCRACDADHRNLCRDYRLIGCRGNLPGAFAELVLVPAPNVTRLDDHTSYVAGALIQPLAVSHHALHDRGQTGADDHVVVVGVGPVGLGCVLLASEAGARVTAVDVDPFRRKLALELGAIAGFAPEELRDRLATHQVERPNVVVEAVGGRQSSTLNDALAWCESGGRVVVVGNFTNGAGLIDPEIVKAKELTVSGSQGYSDSYLKVSALIDRRRIAPEQLVSHVLPWDNPAAAFDLLIDRGREKAKIVLSRTES